MRGTLTFIISTTLTLVIVVNVGIKGSYKVRSSFLTPVSLPLKATTRPDR